MAHQDDYFYEIQLTNKQLVFYFMAVASALVLSFLLGIMVGRGVDQGAGEVVQAARPPQEDRIVTEEAPRPAPTPAEDLTYARRLDSDKADEGLEKPRVAPATLAPAPRAPSRPPARHPARRPPRSRLPARRRRRPPRAPPPPRPPPGATPSRSRSARSRTAGALTPS